MSRNVRAGGATIELGVKNAVDKGLKAAEKSFKDWGGKMQAAGGTMMDLGGAVVNPIMDAVGEFTAIGDKFQKQSLRLGTSVENLSTLKFAAEQSGTSIDSLMAAMQRATRRMGNFAQTGGGPAANAMKFLQQQFGFTTEQIKEFAKQDPTAQLKGLADILMSVGDEAYRNQLAFEIFGDNFKDILPIIQAGSAGIEELQQKARDLGIEMSGEDADAAAAYSDAVNNLTSAWDALVQKIGAAVVPMLTDLALQVFDVAGGIVKWVDENRDLVAMIFKVGAVVMGAGAAISAFGGFMILAGSAVGALATALGVLLSPIGMVTAALVGLGYVVATQTTFFADALDWLTERFGPLIETVKQLGTILLEAFSTGDMEMAWDAIVTFMETTWLDLTQGIMEYWDTAFNYVLDIAVGVAKAIASVFEALGNGLGAMLDAYKDYYNSVYNWVVEKIGEVGGVRTIGGPTDAFAGTMPNIDAQIEAAGKTIGDFGRTMGDAADQFGKANRRDVAQRDLDRQARLKAGRKRLDDMAKDAEASKKRREELRAQPGAPKPGDADFGFKQQSGTEKATTAGTFSAAAAMLMGGQGGTIQEKQLATQERIADSTEAMAEDAENNASLQARFA
jgi:hypothetical protein